MLVKIKLNFNHKFCRGSSQVI